MSPIIQNDSKKIYSPINSNQYTQPIYSLSNILPNLNTYQKLNLKNFEFQKSNQVKNNQSTHSDINSQKLDRVDKHQSTRAITAVSQPELSHYKIKKIPQSQTLNSHHDIIQIQYFSNLQNRKIKIIWCVSFMKFRNFFFQSSQNKKKEKSNKKNNKNLPNQQKVNHNTYKSTRTLNLSSDTYVPKSLTLLKKIRNSPKIGKKYKYWMLSQKKE